MKKGITVKKKLEIRTTRIVTLSRHPCQQSLTLRSSSICDRWSLISHKNLNDQCDSFWKLGDHDATLSNCPDGRGFEMIKYHCEIMPVQ